MRTIQVNMVQHGINYDHLQKAKLLCIWGSKLWSEVCEIP